MEKGNREVGSERVWVGVKLEMDGRREMWCFEGELIIAIATFGFVIRFGLCWFGKSSRGVTVDA